MLSISLSGVLLMLKVDKKFNMNFGVANVISYCILGRDDDP